MANTSKGIYYPSTPSATADLLTDLKDMAESIDTVLDDIDLEGYEKTSDKVTTISSTSTNEQYPSAKAVYDYIQSLDGNNILY